MQIGLQVSYVILWVLVVVLTFLLFGVLRALGLTDWRLQQLEATTPSRIGRAGLQPGKKAPNFSLPGTDGSRVSLQDFAGSRVLLILVQTGCSSCAEIVPELNRLQQSGALRVLVINNADVEAARNWAKEVNARVPVLVQDRWEVSRRYEVFATPFAFLVDEQGTIVSKGIVNSKEHIGYVLSGAGDQGAQRDEHGPGETTPVDK